ncbi:hypothetical protein HGRIS_011050 [Hohenbuehelia grisea]|uniref:Uncharacterized protein n=1 Tax=Hohenbuehelia grisea TaxID=104357 RepID=A0ABR3IYQ5_9AGAR
MFSVSRALVLFSSTLGGLSASIPSNLDQVAINSHCANAQVVNNQTIAVGSNLVFLATLACSPPAANAPFAQNIIGNTVTITVPATKTITATKTSVSLSTSTKSISKTITISISKTSTTTKTATKTTTKITTATAFITTTLPAPAPVTLTVTASAPSPPPLHVCGGTCANSCNNDAGQLPPVSEDCGVIEDAIQIFTGQGPTSFVLDPNHVETLTFGTCSYFFINTSPITLEYCWTDLSKTANAAGAACFPPAQPFTSEGLCTSFGLWAVGAAHS